MQKPQSYRFAGAMLASLSLSTLLVGFATSVLA
jgi:hypothetical protein